MEGNSYGMSGTPFARPGISDEFLAAAGVEYREHPEPHLWIPYHDLDGKLTGHWRSRLQLPRPDGSKYTQPAGTDAPIYFTHQPLITGEILDGVEGEFKTLAGAEEGYQIIGFPGLHTYTRDANKQPQVLPGIWEAVRRVGPREFYSIGDADTISNLQYYRSGQMLAGAFPSVRIKLLQLPVEGPKGLDDLRAQLNGKFADWMTAARGTAREVSPNQSFLIAALIALEAAIEQIIQLPPNIREWHKGRIVHMAAMARLAKEEPRSAIENFCGIAQKAVKLPKPVFEECVADEISRICRQAGAEAPQESETVPAFMETVKAWPEPVDGRILFDGLLALVCRFVVASEEDYHLIVLKIFESYLVDCFSCISIFRVRSPEKRCGKSTLIDVLERLILRPLSCVTVTLASMFRLVTKYHCRFLVDEAESFGKDNDELRAFGCAAYERGRTVPRTNPNTLEVELFETFCWILLASIGELHPTIEDRAVTIFLKRKPRDREIEELCDVALTIFSDFKGQLQRWTDDHQEIIKDLHLPRPKSLQDRNWKKWRSLLSIASEIDQKCVVDTLRTAAHKIREGGEQLSLQIELLGRLRTLFRKENNPAFLPTVTVILKYLNSDGEAPWADWTTGLKKGLTEHRLGRELREHFQVVARYRTTKHQGPHGYRLADLEEHFNLLPPEDEPPKGPDTTPPGGPSPSPAPSSNSFFTPSAPPASYPSYPFFVSPSESTSQGGSFEKLEKEKEDSVKSKATPLDPSESTTYKKGVAWVASTEGAGVEKEKSVLFIPPSTPQASFCAATHPERLLYLDIETFHPWPGSGNFPQPSDKTEKQLAKLEKENKSHPWAKDPRRCTIRFLTICVDRSEPETFDLIENPGLSPEVLHLLATSTLVGHNLDFDLTVLRRYGIPVSNSVVDTMLASRLLGLGKENPHPDEEDLTWYDDEEPDELESEPIYDPTPKVHKYEVVVERYLHIQLAKAVTKLGGSDWGRKDITLAQREYMRDDVRYLVPLWDVLKRHLATEGLWRSWQMRMEFFPHLNQIKMTGNPIDTEQLAAELIGVEAEKEEVRQELKKIFADYRHPIPKSRKKQIKIQTTEGKFTRIPGPEEEEFSPSNQGHHWIPALASHGIVVENTQKHTLQKLDQPECRLLLKYSAASKLVAHMKGIGRSTFPDQRVRSAGWNQLAAVTGRIISVEPNLQQVPRSRRNGFRVDPPKLWLKPDLSQIEVVILAVVTGDEYLLTLIRNEKDVYVVVAAKLFNLIPKRSEEPGCVSETLRDATKPIVLGGNYGLTPYGFIRQMRDELGLEFSLEEAERFFETFFEIFPGVAAYHLRCAEDALTLDHIRTVSGLRRWLPPLYPPVNDYYWPSRDYRKKVLLNTPIQGGQADVQILAVNKYMPLLPPTVEVVNLVHDESDLIVTPATLEETMRIVRTAYQDAFRELYGDTLIPKINFSLGPSWGEAQKIK